MPNRKIPVAVSFETKDTKELLTELQGEIERIANLQNGEGPIKQHCVVIEFHSKSGYFRVIQEERLTPEFGEAPSQEQSVDHIIRQNKSAREWYAANKDRDAEAGM